MTPLRYVILRHEGWGEPHYDLMFETAPGSALATWRSPTWPPADMKQLTRLPDHRRDYLEYEGPVSNNRGFVRRIERGHCQIDHPDVQTWIITLPKFTVKIQSATDGARLD
ncbi:MAG TPA: hypothetical protein VL992_04730 [Tepidisphaeraceae bacterium]|nr:hypothetical protein [Tepidisphaeraceae bacterium]